MATDAKYRIVGDITVRSKTSTDQAGKGKPVTVSYGTNKRTNLNHVAIIQLRQSCAPDSPYFSIEVHRCGMCDVVDSRDSMNNMRL